MNNPTPIIPRSFPLGEVICGFTTRAGGVSPAPFDSLNLGTATADNPEAVRENHRILYDFLGIGNEQVTLMRQVHSGTVRVITRGGLYDATDGILTAEPELLLGVRIADCVPVLLHDSRRRVIGAVHCGWRSIVAGILENTQELMRHEWGCDPADLRAALGPSAGPCCYEIGEDVAAGLAPPSVLSRGGSLFADLHGEIILRLHSAGVKNDRIESIPDCTICNNALYFSHRRDGDSSGRMMGYILLKP